MGLRFAKIDCDAIPQFANAIAMNRRKCKSRERLQQPSANSRENDCDDHCKPRPIIIADAIAELCPLWLQHSASRDVCCPVEVKNHICTNLSFEKLDLIFLSRGVLCMREAALTAIHERVFYGQKKALHKTDP